MLHAPRPYINDMQSVDLASLIETFAKLYSTESRWNYITKTQNRYLANLPQQRQVGDIIVILNGWKTPFLLRRIEISFGWRVLRLWHHAWGSNSE